jgi:hypothetical protein
MFLVLNRFIKHRKQFQQPRPVHLADDLTPDLGDYDRAFGLSGEAIWATTAAHSGSVKQITYLAAALKAPRLL